MSDALADLRRRAEQLLKGTTPAPWAWEPIADKSNEWAVGQAFDANGRPIDGRIPDGEWVDETVIERRNVVGLNESGHANYADAEFIAAAPQLVRDLLAQVQRLEEERDKAKAALVASERFRAADAASAIGDQAVTFKRLTDLRSRLLRIVEQMHHELFRVGNHPALGVDADIVRRWIALLDRSVSSEVQEKTK